MPDRRRTGWPTLRPGCIALPAMPPAKRRFVTTSVRRARASCLCGPERTCEDDRRVRACMDAWVDAWSRAACVHKWVQPGQARTCGHKDARGLRAEPRVVAGGEVGDDGGKVGWRQRAVLDAVAHDADGDVLHERVHAHDQVRLVHVKGLAHALHAHRTARAGHTSRQPGAAPSRTAWILSSMRCFFASAQRSSFHLSAAQPPVPQRGAPHACTMNVALAQAQREGACVHAGTFKGLEASTSIKGNQQPRPQARPAPCTRGRRWWPGRVCGRRVGW